MQLLNKHAFAVELIVVPCSVFAYRILFGHNVIVTSSTIHLQYYNFIVECLLFLQQCEFAVQNVSDFITLLAVLFLY